MTVVAHLDRDYIAEGDDVKRVGNEWTVESIENSLHITLDMEDAQKVRFRLLDDDGEVYYGGWLLNDEDCIVQEGVLEWGKYDAGCTTIQVRDSSMPTDEWRTDIG